MSKLSSFRFPSAHYLQKNLGKLDAIVEFTELAIREVISQSSTPNSKSGYIKTLSQKHEIKVDDVDTEFLKVRLSQLYIIAVYEQAEGFLESFRDEYPNSSEWKYEKDDDLFKRILKNTGKGFEKAKQGIGILEFELFEHYRSVRNCAVHSEIPESKCNARVPHLKSQVELNKSYNKLKAPNLYAEIDFDDFILFTRVVKSVSTSLCKLSEPSEKTLSVNISESMKSGNYKLQFQKLKRLKNNPRRAKNALASFLSDEYGLIKEESANIVEFLYQDLLA